MRVKHNIKICIYIYWLVNLHFKMPNSFARYEQEQRNGRSWKEYCILKLLTLKSFCDYIERECVTSSQLNSLATPCYRNCGNYLCKQRDRTTCTLS